MKNIAIFASGSGTNAENIIKHFETSKKAKIDLVLSNKKDAYVLERAKRLGINTFVFNRNDFYNSDVVINKLINNNIDFIVLAGFLWLVPERLIDIFEGKIINIHPALLPKYGGKGMYGERVHKAVVENHETESGITIHYVNNLYDSGDIIFQAKCEVKPEDTPEMVASKVHALEYEYFPKVIEELVSE
ncbi:MAG: phosphoribosylglycinamide formyltransferase [Bacteroidales bacterium]|nr:phosphoribosylglycinamide formyltransferase [Bacteroidales bacterium]